MLPSCMLLSPVLAALPPSSKGLQHGKSASDNISRNPLGMNTSNASRKCTFQATYRRAQSFRINTYKKTQGEGRVIVNQTPDEGRLSRGASRRGISPLHKGFLSRATIGNEGSLFARRIRIPRSIATRDLSSRGGAASSLNIVRTLRRAHSNARNSFVLSRLLHGSLDTPGGGYSGPAIRAQRPCVSLRAEVFRRRCIVTSLLHCFSDPGDSTIDSPN
jgi:hypothetical protein